MPMPLPMPAGYPCLWPRSTRSVGATHLARQARHKLGVMSVFSMIINGDIPGRFVWKDDTVVSFLTINPVTDGHLLVVPRQEVDHWESVDPELFGRINAVAQTLGQAVKEAFKAPRMGLLIAGLEVPHLHVHVFPAWQLETFDLATADKDPDPAALDAVADKIRAKLRELGHTDHVAD